MKLFNTNPGEQAGNHLPDTKKKVNDMRESTKAEISAPPPIPEPKLPRLFRWKGMAGVVFELDCHSTRNIILQDADHLQYHHQDDWLRKHASEIEWIDSLDGEGE